MAIEMHKIREAVLAEYNLPYTRTNYHKLPADFSTGDQYVVVYNANDQFAGKHHDTAYKVKVMSSAEAKAYSKTGAKDPHRILIWCELHKRWIFAGKYIQHKRTTHK